MNKVSRLILVVLPLLVIGLIFCWLFFTSPPTPAPGCPDFRQQEITIGSNKISVGIAATGAQQAKGLGGCSHLPSGYGLYFPVQPSRQSGVWMKGMLIPIDVIWIDGNRVIGLEPNLTPPASGATLADLPVFHAPSPITAFLELPAGDISHLNISVGDQVETAKFDI